jgi:hypothetical protein
VYRRTDENVTRLVAALEPLHPYVRDAPAGLPFRFDVATVRRREAALARKSSTKRRKGTDHDFAVNAFRVVEQAIGEKMDGSPLLDPDAGKNPHAVALGRLGGANGGQARAGAHARTAQGPRQESR